MSEHPEWAEFVAANPFGFQYAPAELVAMEKFCSSDAFQKRFPKLDYLLSQSKQLILDTKRVRRRHFFTWTDPNGENFGWLCYPPGIGKTKLSLHKDHVLLLSNFGGIDEFWNDPPGSLINNLDHALGFRNLQQGLGRLKSGTQHCPKNVNPKDFITFAHMGDGTLFAYHSVSGEVQCVYFSDATRFDEVLYGLEQEDLHAWIEQLADEHLTKLGRRLPVGGK